jgi:hypothetical protein
LHVTRKRRSPWIHEMANPKMIRRRARPSRIDSVSSAQVYLLRSTLLAGLLIGSLLALLAGCASRGASPKQDSKSEIQPDTGQLIDYLHFAGLKRGDTFEDVVAIFGEPTKINLNEGGSQSKYYPFASAYYKINGEECLEVNYEKSSRKVNLVRVKCAQVRSVLLEKGLDDLKLELYSKPWELISARYGPPDTELSIDGDYTYRFLASNRWRGIVNFTCYDFWDHKCQEIYVQWFD